MSRFGNTQPLPGGGFGAQPAFRQSPFSATSPTLCPKAIPPGYPPKPTVRRDPTPALEKLDIGTTKNQPLPCSVELSPRADMIVALYQQDRDSIKYAVESNILRLASPVFRAMLGDNFREGAELVSSRNELYTLELPEDDAKAMCTLLCILHHTSRQVPTAISQSELLHIAITLEKYDCYEALFPWTQLWLPWAKTIEDDNDALLIAWSFRDKALFEVISRVLILECPTTPDGTIITKSGGPFHETVPESVLGEILRRRNNVVDKLLDVCSAYTKRYAHSDGPLHCKKAVTPSQGQGCDTLMLGAVIKCLLSTCLDPENRASQRQHSAVHISDLLHGLKESIFGFVRQSCCPTPPPQPTFGGAAQLQESSAFCAIHGDENMCPGATFHVKCSFLPQMLKEVNEIFDRVVGLSLDDFDSRKALFRTDFADR